MTDTIQTPAAVPTELMKGVIPYLSVPGASDAAEFYKKAFGAEEVRRFAGEDGRLMHCHLIINGGSLMLSDPFPEHGYGHQPSHSFTMQLVIDDIDAWWKRAVEAGAEVINPVQVMFWGDRYGSLKDAWGVNWAMNAPVKPAA